VTQADVLRAYLLGKAEGARVVVKTVQQAPMFGGDPVQEAEFIARVIAQATLAELTEQEIREVLDKVRDGVML
jgi:hypothetical protein